MKYRILGFVLALLMPVLAQSQKTATPPHLLSLKQADTLHRPRLWLAGGATAIVYPTAMISLWNNWYSEFPKSRFHLFNDNGEWNQMDKVGHAFSAYHETRLGYHLGRWAGMNNSKAIWTGVALGQLVQTSFEVFDGFSEDWGFSLGDMGSNIAGSVLYATQQSIWEEQRIAIKMSTRTPKYPDVLISPTQGIGPPTTLQARADALYGTGLASLLLKNYNAQVVWATVNPRSFAPAAQWLPKWLNIAVGMGSDNMFEGYGYTWQADKNCTGPNCLTYAINPMQFPRTRQWLWSFDVDLTKIPVRNRALRTVFAAFNVFKIPAPTLEWSRQRGVRLHGFYF